MNTDIDPRGILEIDPNVELKDYSGPFKPDLRLTDFSREQLARMYMTANDYFLETAIAFALHITAKYGLDAMYEAMYDVWVNKLTIPFHRMVTEGLHAKGDDVESIVKGLQVILDWGPVTHDITFEMPSKDRAMITCHRCLGVDLAEAIGGDFGQAVLLKICQLDVDTTEEWARHFNPNMVANCLALPPRKSKDDPACKWEFTYKSK